MENQNQLYFGFRIADCGHLISSLLHLFLAHSKIDEEETKLEARNPNSAIRNKLRQNSETGK